MPTAVCRLRPPAPANTTGWQRRRNKSGAGSLAPEPFYGRHVFNQKNSLSLFESRSNVYPAARSADPRHYAEGRRIRPSADRLWTRIQSALGLLSRRFRRVLDLRQHPDPRPEEHHHGPHFRLAPSSESAVHRGRVIRRVRLAEDMDRIARL